MNIPNIAPLYTAQAESYEPEGPQPLMRPIPKGEDYPNITLGLLADVVEAVHDITQAPLAIAAQSALAVASLAVQGFADVETLGGYAPCSLYCLTIAESGERKSSCDRLLMQPLRDYEREEVQAYRELMAAHALAHEIWAAKRKKIMEQLSRADKLKAVALEADLRALGPEPRPPLYPSFTAQDPTLEGLLKLFQLGRPSLGLFSDEGGGFIGGHAMSKDNRLKTISGLSKFWDGDTVNRIRSGDGPSEYPSRRLCLHLMVQPIAAYPLLADPQASGQGFLARFLITQPPSNIGKRLRKGHSPESEAVLRQYGQRLRAILARPMPTGANPQELAPARLRLSHEARGILCDFYAEVEQSQAQGGNCEHIRSYASKAAEQAARLAGVLTLWADLDACEVSAPIMSNAITLARFYLGEARRLTEAGLISDDTLKAERLRQWLNESWSYEDVTPSEIINKGPNALRERKALEAPLAALVNSGHLAKLPAGTMIRGKPRKEGYRIVRC